MNCTIMSDTRTNPSAFVNRGHEQAQDQSGKESTSTSKHAAAGAERHVSYNDPLGLDLTL